MSIIINPNNINEDEEDICLICRENLSNEQTYEIPECKHKYHTNCLINWFRFDRVSCPHCNIDLYFEEKSYRYNYSLNFKKYNTIINFSRRKNAPILLKNKVKKIYEKQNLFNDVKTEIKNVKNENGNYKEINKKIKKLEQKKRRLNYRIRIMKKNLCKEVTVIPIIIRKKITINE